MTPSEINVSVARKLRMKFRINRMEEGQFNQHIVDVDGLSEKERQHLPNFYEMTGHAWQILEALNFVNLVKGPEGWTCHLGQVFGKEITQYSAKSPVVSHAICLAFLQMPEKKIIPVNEIN